VFSGETETANSSTNRRRVIGLSSRLFEREGFYGYRPGTGPEQVPSRTSRGDALDTDDTMLPRSSVTVAVRFGIGSTRPNPFTVPSERPYLRTGRHESKPDIDRLVGQVRVTANTAHDET
jgi:hypothetical protein